MNKTKIRVLSVTVPNGTAAGTFTKQITIDTEFDEVQGVAVSQRKGTDLFDIGFKDTVQTYAEVAPMELYQFNAATNQESRWSPLLMPGAGNTITITYNLLSNAASDNTISFIFKTVDTKGICN